MSEEEKRFRLEFFWHRAYLRAHGGAIILKKFSDPKVTIDEKYKLAEKVYLANVKSDKEVNAQPGETRVIIIKDTNGNQNQNGELPRPVSVFRV